jgi:ribose 5-phosphate isomerase B
MRDVVTADDVRVIPPGGELHASPGAIVTPWAREIAATRGVRIVLGGGCSVVVGADHGGFALKEEIKRHLAGRGEAVRDLGTHSTEPVDYPDVAWSVARAVAAGDARFGVLVDAAGIGSAMAANKVPGVRAALCADAAAARNAREHNDANVLTLGARFVDPARAGEILDVFLATQCTEERHLRRVRKIATIEEAYRK